MGAISNELSRQVAARALAQSCSSRDFNELTRMFMREISHRTSSVGAPDCLFLDIEESGQSIWATSTLGDQTVNVSRNDCRCFSAAACTDSAPKSAGAPACQILRLGASAPVDGEKSEGGPQFDLAISCHSVSFISQPRALCFLKRLRQTVRPGGMLFISALGRYSSLADAYPAGDHPLATRFFPLAPGGAGGLREGTRVCLYSERDLCNTLFEAGWSVIRSSTSTENNVLATAIRI